jgi:hypothetical protein
VTSQITATALQLHTHVTVVLDKDAASMLTALNTITGYAIISTWFTNWLTGSLFLKGIHSSAIGYFFQICDPAVALAFIFQRGCPLFIVKKGACMKNRIMDTIVSDWQNSEHIRIFRALKAGKAAVCW